MPSLDFEVFCDACGAGLCSVTKVKNNEVHVEPCESCLERAAEDGYANAYQDGYDQAQKEFRAGSSDGEEHDQ